MILVDTSVWIDHLHRSEPALQRLLEADSVLVHDLVVQELAVGSLRRRADVLDLLGSLRRAPRLSHDEVLAFISRAKLWGRGLSVVDVELVGSARLAGAALWTRDKALGVASADLDVRVFDSRT